MILDDINMILLNDDKQLRKEDINIISYVRASL